MHPAEYVFTVSDLPLYQSHMVLPGNVIHITIDLKMSVLRRHIRTSFPHHMLLMGL